ncbi:hypothetical protein MAR_031525 [Mya arenaria]|uniref:Uncharacterized protein n=1 Tax=Mya arenaria TaxID=6604 RepID=A0ABY7FCB7_MYAAR|nr:hypothetical protein MAR_031525 [Mya arenaria]
MLRLLLTKADHEVRDYYYRDFRILSWTKMTNIIASCHSPTSGNIPDQRLFQFMLILTKPAAVPLIFIHMLLRINKKKSHLIRLPILLTIPIQLRKTYWTNLRNQPSH